MRTHLVIDPLSHTAHEVIFVRQQLRCKALIVEDDPQLLEVVGSGRACAWWSRRRANLK